MAFLSGWTKRWPITIPSAKVDEALPWFPIFFSKMPQGFWDALDAIEDEDGRSIKIAAADGDTERPIYIPPGGLNVGTKSGIGFARGTGMSHAENTLYYIYAGNDDAEMYAAGDTYGRNAVFAGYGAVWTFTGGDALVDVTGQSGNNLAAQGTPTTGQAGPVEGLQAYALNGDSYVRSTVDAAVGFGAVAHTLETWVYKDKTTTGTTHLFGTGTNFSLGNRRIRLVDIGHTGGASRLRFYSDWSGGEADWRQDNSGEFPASQAWRYMVVAFDGASTSNDPAVYIDGASVSVEEMAAPSGSIRTDADSVAVGARNDGNTPWDGKMSFTAWSGSVRSADYVATMRRAWVDADFYSVGTMEEDTGGGSGSTGWVAFQTSANSSPGGIAWTSTSNALVDNSNFAVSSGHDDDGTTQTLRLTNPDYGSAVPTTATSYTVSFRFRRAKNGEGQVQDLVVRTVIDGSLAGDNLAKSGNWPDAGSPATVEYDATGLTLDGSEFDSTFGLAIQGNVTGAAPFDPLDAQVYYAEVKIDWSDGSGDAITGTAVAGVSASGAATGVRSARGTSTAGVGVSGSSAGRRGLGGSAVAEVALAGAAMGVRACFGAVSASVGVLGSAAGLRRVFGSVTAGVSVVGQAVGHRGIFGTAAALLSAAAGSTNRMVGRARAAVSVAAQAVGFTGTVGPSNGRAFMVYLSGAVADGAPQRDPAASTGGHRSGQRFESLSWDWPDPMLGISVLSLGGGNGLGVGSLSAPTPESLTWLPPGGSTGPAVDLSAGGEATIPGGDSGQWIRVRRTTEAPLQGAKALTAVDIYNNLLPDVATADAVSGLVTDRALFWRNELSRVFNLRVWLGDCDGDIEIALEVPTDGALTGSGLTWSSADTPETAPDIETVLAGGGVGLHIRRTVGADTPPSGSQLWEVRLAWDDATDTYTTAVRGRYRVEREDYEKEGIWFAVDGWPDFDGAPAETWTTRPHTTDLELTGPAIVRAGLRAMNRWGLWGIPSAVRTIAIDGDGDATAVAPSAPEDVTVYQTSGNRPTVGAEYNAAADGDNRAALWVIWLGTDGSTPDGGGTPDGYAVMALRQAIHDLAWTSDGSALADRTPIRALVRTRRLDNAGGTAFRPDVLQLDGANPGTIKVDAEIADWPASGYGSTTTRFGQLLEVFHYTAVAVDDGQTTVTVDQRALWGTSGTATNPTLLVSPVVAVDSTNTETAAWDVVAVAPGRPRGALLYGDQGAQAQAAVAGPDGVTPQVLEVAQNVHLVLGEGWSSLYVDAALVWRVLWQSDGGDANALYIPSEWTLVEGTVSGASAGTGVVDAVDADTIYLVVSGQRRLLIDLAAMEITAEEFNGASALPDRAEQDGALEQFGASIFLVWDVSREDYRPYLELTAAGAVNVGVPIDQTWNAAAVAALWTA